MVQRDCNVTWPDGLEGQPLYNRELGHVIITSAEPKIPLGQSIAVGSKLTFNVTWPT